MTIEVIRYPQSNAEARRLLLQARGASLVVKLKVSDALHEGEAAGLTYSSDVDNMWATLTMQIEKERSDV